MNHSRVYVFDFAEDYEWQDNAACVGHDTDLWFPGQYANDQAKEAKAICAGCPVREQCAAYALRIRIPLGIFGGLTPRARRKILQEGRTAA